MVRDKGSCPSSSLAVGQALDGAGCCLPPPPPAATLQPTGWRGGEMPQSSAPWDNWGRGAGVRLQARHLLLPRAPEPPMLPIPLLAQSSASDPPSSRLQFPTPPAKL
ncbi:hypothetical protein KIL84_020839 [Mauremys mutica]|uniref:Uncharacterized protein n=1 Tax=Mauremys mutica TaxID=74926 RepID=A0A9D3XBR7_9SAUR|nr:hypothetical protein KIL84_020839 [Mauremys mutica]